MSNIKGQMIIQTENLIRSFDGFIAINRVNFSVERGDIHAIIGPNGAGKTTFFNLITGFLKPDSGRIFYNGKDITGLPSYEICRNGIARSFQVARIYAKLTLKENIQVALFSKMRTNLSLFSSARKMFLDRVTKILETVGLTDEIELPAGELSHGDRKSLELAMTLAHEPSVLLLDEPTAGMSPIEATNSTKIIQKINEEMGITILFTEHDMSVVFGIAKKITVLHQGSIIAQGEPITIQKSDTLKKIYFGEDAIQ